MRRPDGKEHLMSHANEIFWPELHPDAMPAHFNDYAQRLLAEGDSWFAWAYLGFDVSPSLLTELRFGRRTATLCYACSGDTSGDMARMSMSAGFKQEFSARRFDAVLLSGGGNDLFDALARGHILRPAGGGDPADPASYFDTVALDTLKAYVTSNYAQILAWRRLPSSLNKSTPVLLHTYDYPMPRPSPAEAFGLPAAGPWLLPALQAVGAPAALRFEIIRRIADDMLGCVRALHDPAAGIYVVDTCGTLTPASPAATGGDADWANEIHPNAAGYARLAARFKPQLAAFGVF
ncbi:MAG: SGNH/GDSL hydrolase family protein [Rhodocyclaceae bacterium]|nr:MAG: SGNH/GDSL hydrolase family protein [Rhodocyclaceae bacterium]